MIHAVILSGGAGKRLWPLSSRSNPKQFLPLIGQTSLFAATVERVRAGGLAERLIVVTGADHLEHVTAQLDALSATATVLLEPAGRNSAPAIAAAVTHVLQEDPDGVVLVVASDHFIPDAEAFGAAARIAVAAAERDHVVTFGARPTHASTAYGYLRIGAPLAGLDGVNRLEGFVEKPDAETAAGYMRAGHLWNTGNFCACASVLRQALSAHAPEVLSAAAAAVREGRSEGPLLRLGDAFRSAPDISIDYAVMERVEHAAVVPVDYIWSDLGAWDAVWQALPKHADGNAQSGATFLRDSRDCLVRAEGDIQVAVLGGNRLAVVATGSSVLVCDLDHAQSVKDAAIRFETAPAPPPPATAATTLRETLWRWLDTAALPLWWTHGADRVHGGFHESLTMEGQPTDAPRRFRVQARQVFVYATAGRLGWAGPWRDAVEHGLNDMLTRWRRPDGLFRTLMSAEGATLENGARLYDQPFALLAFASAAQVLPDRRGEFAGLASELLVAMRAAFAHPVSGFREAPGGPSLSNPHMHLLEAALGWADVDENGPWETLADSLAGLCLSRFIDRATGALRETFDDEWSPAAGVEGRRIEPGHHYEWAWLLHRWAERRARPDAAATAARLFALGERGVDPSRGVAVNSLLDDFSVLRGEARLWPQTERLRTATRLQSAPSGDNDGCASAAASAGGALLRYLDTPVRGLWRDTMELSGRFRADPASASSLYHIVGAIEELSAGGERVA